MSCELRVVVVDPGDPIGVVSKGTEEFKLKEVPYSAVPVVGDLFVRFDSDDARVFRVVARKWRYFFGEHFDCKLMCVVQQQITPSRP